MKRTLILTLAVLAAALAVCWVSQAALNGTVDEAERLQSLAALAEQEERIADAKSLMVRLAEHWTAKSNVMEMMAGHDDLHDVGAAIADAQICLECDDHDAFRRAMAAVRAGLEHLKDEEALRLSNLY